MPKEASANRTRAARYLISTGRRIRSSRSSMSMRRHVNPLPDVWVLTASGDSCGQRKSAIMAAFRVPGRVGYPGRSEGIRTSLGNRVADCPYVAYRPGDQLATQTMCRHFEGVVTGDQGVHHHRRQRCPGIDRSACRRQWHHGSAREAKPMLRRDEVLLGRSASRKPPLIGILL